MNSEQYSQAPATRDSSTPVADEVTRVKLFIGIQAFFLVVSIFTGGFHFKLWSMLDTALLIQSIGITGLVVVIEEAQWRRIAFKAHHPVSPRPDRHGDQRPCFRCRRMEVDD